MLTSQEAKDNFIIQDSVEKLPLSHIPTSHYRRSTKKQSCIHSFDSSFHGCRCCLYHVKTFASSWHATYLVTYNPPPPQTDDTVICLCSLDEVLFLLLGFVLSSASQCSRLWGSNNTELKQHFQIWSCCSHQGTQRYLMTQEETRWDTGRSANKCPDHIVLPNEGSKGWLRWGHNQGASMLILSCSLLMYFQVQFKVLFLIFKADVLNLFELFWTCLEFWDQVVSTTPKQLPHEKFWNRSLVISCPPPFSTEYTRQKSF